MAKEFTTELVTIKELFRGDKIDTDQRNYYIPLYQRKYAWTKDNVKKLVSDIKEASDLKSGLSYQPYFIGGLVLSQESIEGPERTKKSLEVIDGQQRLTTITLLLSVCIQQIKSKERDYSYDANLEESLSKEIKNLIYSSEFNFETRENDFKLKVEREDDLKELYTNVIKDFSESIVDIETYFNNKRIILEDEINLKEVLIEINRTLNELSDDEFVDFIFQLLRYTYVVVTLTNNVDTGFLVFEKLNDSGISLEPQDLIKNYLFRTSDENEYESLTNEWKKFLDDIYNINKSKSKISPREFLESYLISIGKKVDVKDKDKKRTEVFNLFKTLRQKNYDESINLLLDLRNTAVEYRHIKADSTISFYLNKMNFKLGYILFLSFYKRFGQYNYRNKKNDILLLVIRLGLAFLLTGNSKQLSEKIPIICKRISETEKDIDETLTNIKSFIDGLLENISEEFLEIISLTNVYRKKGLISILLDMINYHLENIKLGKNIYLVKIMPPNLDLTKYQLTGIINENIEKISNQFGNLTIVSHLNEDDEKTLDDNIEYLITNFDLALISDIKNNMNFDKFFIEERTQKLTKLAINVIIKGEIDSDYLLDSILYYIDRTDSKNAKMLIIDGGYKVLKGSKCNPNDIPYEFSYTKLRENLLREGILVKKDAYLEFTKDYVFDSPSAAASIITARQSAGPLDWKDINGVTLKEKENL
ncbi:DUF4357 domain-containing protein [Aliarcobacter butzleri]